VWLCGDFRRDEGVDAMTACSQQTGRQAAWILTFSLALSLMMAAEGRAGFLPSDSFAMDGWHDTVSGLTMTVGTKTVRVHIDYAVYAPGQFTLSLQNQIAGGDQYIGAAQDPSGGAQYVYAYEVFNEASSNGYLSQVSVQTDPNGQATNIGLIGDGGLIPGSYNFSGTTSAVWNYPYSSVPADNKTIPSNNHSEILIFTSPFGPKWMRATLNNSAGPAIKTDPSQGGHGVPSPIPEPGTLWLLVAGGAVLFAGGTVGRARSG
jgi:hypothetical protein